MRNRTSLYAARLQTVQDVLVGALEGCARGRARCGLQGQSNQVQLSQHVRKKQPRLQMCMPSMRREEAQAYNHNSEAGSRKASGSALMVDDETCTLLNEGLDKATVPLMISHWS